MGRALQTARRKEKDQVLQQWDHLKWGKNPFNVIIVGDGGMDGEIAPQWETWTGGV